MWVYAYGETLMTPENGWNEYERLVLFRLNTLDSQMRNLDSKVSTLMTQIAILKFKASLYGTASGMIAGAVMMGIAKRWGV